jgi:SAM-dependent methyltransferase
LTGEWGRCKLVFMGPQMDNSSTPAQHSALAPTVSHEQEVRSGDRFAFGENWSRFLTVLDEPRIEEAMASLRSMLEADSLRGQTFLDIGSGSGLFSLAARRLGAKVLSFDYDAQSVACTRELKRRFFHDDGDWEIQRGSVLDLNFLERLGQFDVVYSWGVLHHTGAMWTALANVAANVAANGKLFIALYNHQPFASRYWSFVKRSYNKHPFTRPFLILVHAMYPTMPSMVLKRLQRRKLPRGMSLWHDLVDWLGGYPFETSTPDEIFDFYKRRGFRLQALKTVGGKLGCNEFVFQRLS